MAESESVSVIDVQCRYHSSSLNNTVMTFKIG